MTRENSAAILMTKCPGETGTANPLKPEGHWLHEAGMIGYVMQQGTRGPKNTPRLELWTSHGSLGEAWSVGAVQRAHHDQSGITKCGWRIVGVVRWNGDGNAPEVVAGDVPSRKIPHGVFK